MVIGKELQFQYQTEPYVIRDVGTKHISDTYLKALRAGSEFISGIPKSVSRESQAAYIESIRESPTDCLLGLFANDTLIGTSGVQMRAVADFTVKSSLSPAFPIATVGIFIFDSRYRGIGLGCVLVWAAVTAHASANLTRLYGAGMNQRNVRSYKAFLRCGFRMVETCEEEYRVAVGLDELVCPDGVEQPAS